jgi:ADP-ribose pyrophosphatase YjhB (NUDIX family)
MITCAFENGDEVGLRHVVVSTIIFRKGKVLLEKRGLCKGKPMLEFGKWALIGGFLDRDELLTDAVKREAMEETGLEVTNLKLFRIIDNPVRSNDNNRQNVAFIFTSEVIDYNPVENEEVSELKWFDLDQLPPKEEIAFDFYETLEMYKKYLKENFTLPLLG